MNFGKKFALFRQKRGNSGNAMIYILLAIALLGGLTMSLMRQDSQGGDDLSQDQAEFMAAEILGYSAAAQNVIDQMIITGANPADLDFALPSATSFNTAPYFNKFYHPQGGGMNFKPATTRLFDMSSGVTNPLPGFYITRPNNIEWTPTTAPDIVVAAYYIPKTVCETINKKITGSTTIPNVPDIIKEKLIHGPTVGFGYTNSTFTKIDCPACEGYSALCINRSGAAYTFYSIILAR